VQLRLDNVGQSDGIADEDRLRAEPAQSRARRSAVDAESSAVRYRFDLNFAISSPASMVDEGLTPSDHEYRGEKPRRHWGIRGFGCGRGTTPLVVRAPRFAGYIRA
jgi:hypothetical protein